MACRMDVPFSPVQYGTARLIPAVASWAKALLRLWQRRMLKCASAQPQPLQGRDRYRDAADAPLAAAAAAPAAAEQRGGGVKGVWRREGLRRGEGL
jgi:hypothetical protein